MPLNDVIIMLKKFFSTQPVEKVWLFGSYARGEQREDSDIDLLVKYSPGIRLGLFGILTLIENLETYIGKKIDLVEEGALFPRIEKEVEKQKIMIYERIA